MAVTHVLRQRACIGLAVACAVSSCAPAPLPTTATVDAFLAAADAPLARDTAGGMRPDVATPDASAVEMPAPAGCGSTQECPPSPYPCSVYACTPHGCELQPLPDGSICNDGSDCTLQDACLAGQCQGRPQHFAAEWATEHDDEARAVVRLADGFLLAGTRTFEGGRQDVLLTRSSSLGDKLWEKVVDLGYDEHVWAAAAADVGVAIAGEAAGPKHADALLARLSLKGEVVWQQVYGGAEHDRAYALAAGADGGLVAAGSNRSEAKDGTTDFWAFRTDPAGAVTWSRVWGAGRDERAHGVALLAGGGVAVAGTASGGGAADQGWLARLDGNGQPVWQTSAGAGTRLFAVAAAPGGLYACGQKVGTPALGLIARFDAGGKLLGTHTLAAKGLEDTKLTGLLPPWGDLVGVYGYRDGKASALWWVHAATQHDLEVDLGVGRVYGGASFPGGTAFAVTRAAAAMGSHALVRGGAWGAPSCDAKPCNQGGLDECSDGAACTVDVCDPAWFGCLHWEGCP